MKKRVNTNRTPTDCEQIPPHHKSFEEHEHFVNRIDDFPILHSDIINITPNQHYKLIITFESGDSVGIITPTITLPNKKGYMMLNGKKHHFMLSTCNDPDHQVSEIDVLSELGYIDISYHHKTQDYRDFTYWGSSKVLRRLGMKKEILSASKVRYSCTNTSADRFDHYVFTVEWFRSDSKP